MGFDWLAPVATGTVGIAGMAATLFATFAQRRAQADLASLQRSHQQIDVTHSQKKTAYLQLLAAISEAENQLSNARRQGQIKRKDNIDLGLDLYQISMELVTKLSVTLDEVALVAPEWVTYRAMKSRTRTVLWMTSFQLSIIDPELTEKGHKEMLAARMEFLISARADLQGEGKEVAADQIKADQERFLQYGNEKLSGFSPA